MKLLKFYHTVKFLKPVQISNRILRKLSIVNFNPPSTCRNNPTGYWLPFSLLPSSYKGNSQFKFLNLTETVSDWNDETKPKLWLYNLHYFDDLIQEEYINRTEIHFKLIDSWIVQNPTMFGNGWEPYTISLRTVNWIKWFLLGTDPKQNWLDSLSLQVQALEQQLEYHLLGNHLFANAKALVFAGCFFSGDDADRWRKRGLDILEKEVSEQILNDGGHFELSPMYHNIILGDLIDLYQLSFVYSELIPIIVREFWCETIIMMIKWAESMKHPDGEISFFNDSAFRIAPCIKTLQLYATKLNLSVETINKAKVTFLESSGYVVVEDDIYKLIIDTAKVGPDYIPGHAHADTLSFELSVNKDRVFVNSGTSLYENCSERMRQRKTAAHNTVVVDNNDSSEVWSGFRVAKRAYPSRPVVINKDSVISVECSHDGYMRLPGKVIHTRKWQLIENEMFITDHLSGAFKHASSHYHIHPIGIGEKVNNDNQVMLHLPSGAVYIVTVEGADIQVIDTTWHPEFGLSVANKKLVLNFKNNQIKFTFSRV